MSNSTVNAKISSVKKCRARACAYLAEIIGCRPETLVWDSAHCLQGHAQLGCSEIIVIANHDALHAPVVMTAPDWDAVRRSSAGERQELIRTCAITDHSRLVSILERDEVGVHAVAA